jgi:uncharacterized protein (AIM24 family)
VQQGVSVGIEFSKKLGRGFFGGEGFIMQKIEGDGLAFVHSGGTLAKKELRTGEVLKVDTGAASWASLKMSITILNSLAESRTPFRWRGLFYATLRGPGTVYIQSLPFSRLADRIIASAPKAGGSSRGEGSTRRVRKFTRWR